MIYTSLLNEILHALLDNKDLMLQASRLTSDFFGENNNQYFLVFKAGYALTKKYGKSPTKASVISEVSEYCKNNNNYGKLFTEITVEDFIDTIYSTPYDALFIREKLYKTFGYSEALKLAESIVEKAQSGNEDLLKFIRDEATQKFLSGQVFLDDKNPQFIAGMDDSTLASYINNFNSPDDLIPTGFDLLDRVLGGGILNYGGLTVYLAPPNRGKTAILLAHAINCSMLGYKCLFISGETYIPTLYKRMFAGLSGVPMEELALYKDTVVKQAHNALRRVGGDIVFESFVGKSDFTPAHIENLVKYYVMNHGINMVFVDYLDLLQPNTKSKDSYRLQLSEITQEARNIATRWRVPMITVAQTNKTGVNTPIITEENIGEDFNKVKIADIIISINSTIEEYNNNEMRFFIIKNRDGAKFKMIKLIADFRTMNFTTTDDMNVVEFLSNQSAKNSKEESE